MSAEILRKAGHRRRFSASQAFILYRCFEVAAVTDAPLSVPFPRAGILCEAVENAMVSCTGGDPLPLVHRVRGWEESYNDGKELPIVPVKVGGTLALRIIADGWPYFHVVPLRKIAVPAAGCLGPCRI